MKIFRDDILAFIVVLASSDYLVRTHVVQNEMNLKHEHARALKEKWSATDLVRDINHIKEDMRHIVELSQAGVITFGEGYFYYFRMHDFNSDDGLDGLEMYFAMNHLGQHDNDETSQQNLIDHVDEMLKMDMNQDGILTYAEMKHHMPALNDEQTIPAEPPQETS